MIDFTSIIKNLIIFKKKYFIYFIIFLFAFSLRIYAIQNRNFLQVDELNSFFVSTPANHLPDGHIVKKAYNEINIPADTRFKGKELKKILFESEKSLKSVINDLKILRENSLDKQHSNFYFSILRIYNINFFDIHNIRKSLIYDSYLNLVFFTISFFFLYKLLALIKPEKGFITICLLFASVSAGGIFNTILVRNYSLSEMFFVMSTFFTLKLFLSFWNKNYSFNMKDFIIYPLIYSGLILSDYFTLIYFALFVFVLVINCLIKKEYKYFVVLAYFTLMTILITYLIYPDYFLFKTNDNYYLTLKNNSLLYSICGFFKFQNIKLGIITLTKYIFKININIIIIICLMLFYIFRNKCFDKNSAFKKEELKIIGILIIFPLIWMFLTEILAYWKEYRYIYNATAFIMLLPACFTFKLKKSLAGLIIIIYCIIVFLFISNENSYAFMNYMNNSYSLGRYKNLDNLIEKRILVPSNDIIGWQLSSKMPLIVTYQKSYYLSECILLFLNDNSDIYFYNKNDVIPFNKYFLLSCITEEDYNNSKILDYYDFQIKLINQ